MKHKCRKLASAALAFAAAFASGADWVYDNGTLSDGVWTFGAALNGNKLNVTTITSGPSELTPLDFSKPVKDVNDTPLVINQFWRTIYNNGTYAPRVGQLTLPSNYTRIDDAAFSGCINATGSIEFTPELSSIGGNAFFNCKHLVFDPAGFPEGIKTIDGGAFKNSSIQGDVVLPGVKTVNQEAFAATGIRSVTFGPSLTTLSNYAWGGAAGVFQNCTSLESVYIDTEASVTITYGNLFYGCSSLTEIDLSGVVHIEQNADNLGHFSHSNLRKATFGSKLDYLDGRLFNGATKLEQVIFKGHPPTTITNTFLLGAGNGGEVTTYVILDPSASDYASAKAAWDALTAGGEINAVDSTWKTNYIGNAPVGTRHLLLYEIEHVSIEAARDADEGEGVVGTFTVSRSAGESVAGPLSVNYTVGGTAVAGQTYGALSGSMTIPAGSTSGTIEVVPLDDPATTSNTTVVVTLSDGDYEIVAGRRTATVNVINGASFPGWKYTVTGNNAGTMSKGGWTFSATHSGRDLTVGAVTAWPDEVSELDFSAIVAGSDGHAYTIARLGSSNDGLGLAGTDPGNVPHPSEPGDRVGLLTLPGEGLTSICDNAFACCTNAYGALSFPSSLVSVGGSAFRFTKISGDLTFPALETLQAATFEKTKITSATFGPALKSTNGAWERGPFAGCTSLTNVVFDPASKVDFQSQGYTFWNCSALTDLDLSCATNFAWGSGVGARFHGCTSLTNITFGTGLAKLPANLFQDATALQSVHFKGPAPVIVGDGGLFTGVGSSQTIKAYVPLRMSEKATFGQTWKSYAADGVLDTASSRWREDLLASGDNTRFYLLLEDAPPPTVIVIK